MPNAKGCGLMQEQYDIQHPVAGKRILLRCGLMQEQYDIQLNINQQEYTYGCGLMQEQYDIQQQQLFSNY